MVQRRFFTLRRTIRRRCSGRSPIAFDDLLGNITAAGKNRTGTEPKSLFFPQAGITANRICPRPQRRRGVCDRAGCRHRITIPEKRAGPLAALCHPLPPQFCQHGADPMDGRPSRFLSGLWPQPRGTISSHETDSRLGAGKPRPTRVNEPARRSKRLPCSQAISGPISPGTLQRGRCCSSFGRDTSCVTQNCESNAKLASPKNKTPAIFIGEG